MPSTCVDHSCECVYCCCGGGVTFANNGNRGVLWCCPRNKPQQRFFVVKEGWRGWPYIFARRVYKTYGCGLVYCETIATWKKPNPLKIYDGRPWRRQWQSRLCGGGSTAWAVSAHTAGGLTPPSNWIIPLRLCCFTKLSTVGDSTMWLCAGVLNWRIRT